MAAPGGPHPDEAIDLTSSPNDDSARGARVSLSPARAVAPAAAAVEEPAAPATGGAPRTPVAVAAPRARAPRRSARSGSSSARGSAKERDAEGMACMIWDRRLKPDGWKYGPGKAHEFAIYPSSLAAVHTLTLGKIKNKGMQGVHWADGYVELGKMLEKYGLKHGPSSLKDYPPELPLEGRKSLSEIHAELFPEPGMFLFLSFSWRVVATIITKEPQ